MPGLGTPVGKYSRSNFHKNSPTLRSLGCLNSLRLSVGTHRPASSLRTRTLPCAWSQRGLTSTSTGAQTLDTASLSFSHLFFSSPSSSLGLLATRNSSTRSGLVGRCGHLPFSGSAYILPAQGLVPGSAEMCSIVLILARCSSLQSPAPSIS